MPPIQQQQSSRAGLITALVISIICALGFLVWAIMESSGRGKAETANRTLQDRYKSVIAESRVGDITNLRTAFGAANDRVSVIDAAESQRKNLVKMITGNPETAAADVTTAVQALSDQVAKSEALKDAAIPSTSLAAMVQALTKKAEADTQVIAGAKKARDDALRAKDAADKQNAVETATRDAAVKTAQDMAAKSQTDAQTAIAEKQKQVDDFTKQLADAQKALEDARTQGQVAEQTAQRKVETVQKGLEQAQLKLSQFRGDVKNPVMRAPDARITQVAPDSICYIDLGFGDHIVQGLTFEVYDRADGVPPLGDGSSNLDLPKGKASIEVIVVGQNSSQCRVTRVTAGQTLSQGDICANVIYDRNVKPVFYVYGKFDIDQNNVATDQETEVIKNLIQRWGGRLTDKLNVDVDYVIMGKEPTLPNYSKEELAESPIAKQRYDEAQAALKAYDDVRGNAADLHAPLMNQNRFLYYIGYYEMARR
jgi:hypothetical protein